MFHNPDHVTLALASSWLSHTSQSSLMPRCSERMCLVIRNAIIPVGYHSIFIAIIIVDVRLGRRRVCLMWSTAGCGATPTSATTTSWRAWTTVSTPSTWGENKSASILTTITGRYEALYKYSRCCVIWDVNSKLNEREHNLPWCWIEQRHCQGG